MKQMTFYQNKRSSHCAQQWYGKQVAEATRRLNALAPNEKKTPAQEKETTYRATATEVTDEITLRVEAGEEGEEGWTTVIRVTRQTCRHGQNRITVQKAGEAKGHSAADPIIADEPTERSDATSQTI